MAAISSKPSYNIGLGGMLCIVSSLPGKQEGQVMHHACTHVLYILSGILWHILQRTWH